MLVVEGIEIAGGGKESNKINVTLFAA